MQHRLAIFASGAGSNARAIINFFKKNEQIEIALIICNKPDAGVFSVAEKENIKSILISKEKYKVDGYASFLKENRIDFIILAGFLWKIPPQLIAEYPGKIINIHPALLPAYGGKGMYGHFVHDAVIKNKEQESGITIHYVDEQYDHGNIIFQSKCRILPEDTPESLAQKIHALEHEYFPKVIERVLMSTE